MSYYACITKDHETIMGIGTTAAEAIEDAHYWCDGNILAGDYETKPCTERLYTWVKESGSTSFDEIDGVLDVRAARLV